jgi:DNA-binding NarL/FixJ family response regulator
MSTSPPQAHPIKVLPVDDEALVRSGFRLLLGLEDAIAVVGEATNGAEAVALTHSCRPQVVLMDIRMPQMDGIQATREIARTRGLQGVRILILTTYDTDAYVFDGLAAGASGFLLKDPGPSELLHGTRVVAAGEALLAPRITRRLIAQFTTRTQTEKAAEDCLRIDRTGARGLGPRRRGPEQHRDWRQALPQPPRYAPTSVTQWRSSVHVTGRSWSSSPTRSDSSVRDTTTPDGRGIM